MNIKKFIREIEDYPEKGVSFKDITIIILIISIIISILIGIINIICIINNFA